MSSSLRDVSNLAPAPAPASRSAAPKGARKQTLDARWLFDAALLSNPIDLSSLVALSKAQPRAITGAAGLLERMVDVCLNSDKKRGVDKDTRLDVLLTLGNVARDDESRATVQRVLETVRVARPSARARARDDASPPLSTHAHSRSSRSRVSCTPSRLQVSAWFDEYLHAEEGDAARLEEDGEGLEPELHKAMLVLLCRAYDYALRTADVLELCGGDRALALETIVGVLEDGEQAGLEIVQKTAAAAGQRAVWEKRDVAVRHEKPLVTHICQLLRGFTHPDTYFQARHTEEAARAFPLRSRTFPLSEREIHTRARTSQATEDGFYFLEAGVSLPENCIHEFSRDVEALLVVTLESGLVAKLTAVLHGRSDHLPSRSLRARAHRLLARRRPPPPPAAARRRRADCLFSDGRVLDDDDHAAVAAVHEFLHNIHAYSMLHADEYRAHLLCDTPLVPQLVLPYLERCVCARQRNSPLPRARARLASLRV